MSIQELTEQKMIVEQAFGFLVYERGYSGPQTQSMWYREFDVNYVSAAGPQIQIGNEVGASSPDIFLDYPQERLHIPLFPILKALGVAPKLPLYSRLFHARGIQAVLKIPFLGSLIFLLIALPWLPMMFFFKSKRQRDYLRCATSYSIALRDHYDAILKFAQSPEGKSLGFRYPDE